MSRSLSLRPEKASPISRDPGEGMRKSPPRLRERGGRDEHLGTGTGASLSFPVGKGSCLGGILLVTQPGSPFWGQQEQRAAWKAAGPFLHPKLFRCRVTSDTSLHLSSKTPKGNCKPAKASVKIPPPGTQSKSKRLIKCAWKSLEHTRTR